MLGDHTDEEYRKALRSIKRRILVYAFPEEVSLERKAQALLAVDDALPNAMSESLPEWILSAMDTGSEEKLAFHEPGPLLFILNKEHGVSVFNFAECFLDTELIVREKALRFLDFLLQDRALRLCPATLDVLGQNRTRLLAAERDVSLKAGVSLYDALENDFLMTLAGMRQSLVSRYEQGCSEYFNRLLDPSAKALNILPMRFSNPGEQKDEIIAEIAQLVAQNESLSATMSQYLRTCGYLPLCEQLSMGKVLEEWTRRRDEAGRIWEELWEWAHQAGTPLAYYHICQALAMNPHHIPAGGGKKLWHEIADILRVEIPSVDGKADELESWRIRGNLSEYYLRYIEYMLPPGISGDNAASAAVWLSEQVSQLLTDTPDYLYKIRNDFVVPALEFSTSLWRLLHPNAGGSGLRLASYEFGSIWGVSLLCMLGSKFGDMRASEIEQDDVKVIGRHLGRLITYGFASHGLAEAAVFAMDEGLSSLVDSWPDVIPDITVREQYCQILNEAREMSKNHAIVDALRHVSEDEERCILASRVLTTLAYTGRAPLEEIWKAFTENDLFTDWVLKAKPSLVELLFGAVGEIQNQSLRQGQMVEEWVYTFPHLLALACEKAETDIERRTLLIAMLVVNSIQTGTSSALARVFRSDKTENMIRLRKEWQESLKHLCKTAPSVVAARVRAVLVCLEAIW